MRIILVDDHELFRTGVRQTLWSVPEFKFVGEAPTARAAFALVDALAPDVVLMDITLPGMDGVVATREIKRRAPKTRVLIMSAHDQLHDVTDALSAGAVGYMLKSDGPETLVAALRAIARGETYLAPTLASRLSAYRASSPQTNVLTALSEREREVFRLAAECLPARDIARELCIARKTADTHLNRIHRKLGSRNLAELVSLASRMGISHTGLTRHQVTGSVTGSPAPTLSTDAPPMVRAPSPATETSPRDD